jgi:hypothetical protein
MQQDQNGWRVTDETYCVGSMWLLIDVQPRCTWMDGRRGLAAECLVFAFYLSTTSHKTSPGATALLCNVLA